MHTGCVIPVVTFVTLDCVVLVVYLLSTGAAWVVLRGGVCVTLGLGPGFGCRSPACASRYRRVMLCGFVGIILFFLETDRFGNGGGFLVN